jgi:hypothetical protein
MAFTIIFSKWSWNISVSIVTRPWAQQPKDCGLIASRKEEIVVFSKMSTTVLGPTFKWVASAISVGVKQLGP